MIASLRLGSSARWAAILVALLFVAGCPAPTGRRRGSINADGGACALQSRPATGESCTTPSAVCDFEVPCDSIGRPDQLQTERCTCAGGRWNCSAVDACFTVLPDGAVACPDDDRPGGGSTFACGARFEGRVCQLRPFTCENGERPQLSCRCDGNFWQCEPVMCSGVITRDGGMPGPGTAGNPCVDDTDCAPLTCAREVPGGVCTGVCNNSPSQANEQMQCGGSSTTCLSDGTGGGNCFAACRAGAAGSGCRPGFACTGLWFTQMDGTPDTAACFPFCSSDMHCAAGTTCNERTGQCDNSRNPMALADGMPCRVGSNACRGQCFRITEMGEIGVCGSFIDIAQTSTCPDGDGRVQPFGQARDNLALCIFQQCSESDCCPDGLVCEAQDGSGFCLPDDPSQPNVACTSADAGADGGRDASVDSGG
ncbi:MAG: hypothetical protein JNK05_03780 [Myxococcales bacterium]|nr:hypothetical protein [Myxococcales bacterium]